MTVRVNKSSFNIREKLSELGRKFGLKGSELAAAETVQEAREVVSAGRKNLVINGAMSINQRYGTSSHTIPNATGGTYVLDRWAINEATDGSVSVNMDGDPAGGNGAGLEVQEFTKAMQIACTGTDTSIGSTQNLHFFQNIEGYNTIGLKWGTTFASDVTLSFWVRSNVPGIYCVGLENNATNRSCIKEYTVNSGFKWQKVVLTFPGCTDGTWVKDNGCGIRLRFCLATGASYDDATEGVWGTTDELATTNQTNFMTSTNNRFFITGVQLEKGRNATNFEHRPRGEELSLCQRYYQKIYYTNSDYPFGYCYTYQQGASACAVPLSTPMRIVSPDINFSTLRIRGYNQDGTNGSQAITSISGTTQESHALIQLNVGHTNVPSAAVGAGSVLTNGLSNSSSYLEIVAEL